MALTGQTLLTSGLTGPMLAESVADRPGRYRLPLGACILDPLTPDFLDEERTYIRENEVSKLKRQGLVCARNAKLVAANLKHITYAMKEGSVRVIIDSEGTAKLHNSTQAVIVDMAINGAGSQGTIIFCVDEAARVSIFLLEAQGGKSPEQRTKQVELVFPSGMDAPQRILGHPTDKHIFVTMHANHLAVWSMLRLEQEDPRDVGENGFITHVVDEWLLARASQQFVLPGSTELEAASSGPAAFSGNLGVGGSALPRLRDIAISVDATCLVALVADALCVWRLRTSSIGESSTPELLQKLSLDSPAAGDAGLHSLRVLGTLALQRSSETPSGDDAEVLIVGSGTGCELFAYQFRPSTPSPVGPLRQSIRIVSPNGDELVGCIERDSINHDILGLAFRNKTLVLVLPLARGWSASSTGSPLPYAQRFVTNDPAHLLSIHSGRSYSNASGGETLLIYHAHNFTREKDSLLGCAIVLHEVVDPQMVEREEASPPAKATDSAEAAASSVMDQHDAAAGEGPAAVEAAAAGAPIPLAPQGDMAATGAPGPLAPEVVVAVAGAPVPLVPQADAAAAGAAPTPNGAPAGLVHARGMESSPAELPEEPGGPSGDAVPPEAAEDEPGSANPAEEAAPPPGLEVSAAATGEPQAPAPSPALTSGVAEPAIGVAAPTDSSGGENGDARITDEDAAVSGSAGAGVQDLGAASRSEEAERKPEQRNLDWGFVKHIAASFQHGLDKRKGEMSEQLLSEIHAVVKEMEQNGQLVATFSEADQAALDQALSRIREAREVQATCERNLQAASGRARDAWAEASATAVANLLQKELCKISDGIAATLAQQLSQSRKFCEALARGVQKSGGVATRQALEALRPPHALQEVVGNALTEALHESLTPIFKAEVRAHFNQELAPLIGQRVYELLHSMRENLSTYCENLAAEQVMAGQRLGQELTPIIEEELKQVERRVSQQRDAKVKQEPAELSEEQMDEIQRTLEAEIVQPLQAKIEDLTAQVQFLTEQAKSLEERWSNRAVSSTAGGSSACAAAPPVPAACPFGMGLLSATSSSTPALSVAEDPEEVQARELERLFREGKAGNAFATAMAKQVEAPHYDYLARVCALVPDGEGCLEQWLEGDPITMQVKMLLMLTLAKQLNGPLKLSEAARGKKIEWVNELWFAFNWSDKEKGVREEAPIFVQNLSKLLERIPVGSVSSDIADKFHNLKKSVRFVLKHLSDRDPRAGA